MVPAKVDLDSGYRSTEALICTGFTPTNGPWKSAKETSELYEIKRRNYSVTFDSIRLQQR